MPASALRFCSTERFALYKSYPLLLLVVVFLFILLLLYIFCFLFCGSSSRSSGILKKP